jgi:Cu/Ag efflux protein CusF
MVLAFVVAGFSACGEKTAKQDLNIERAEMASVSATVEAVDQKTRLVTLRDAEGKLITFFAGKEVVNLPQVKAGDTVTVAYANVVKVRMAESGEYWDDSLAEVARAIPGDKPGMVAGGERTVTATIEDIDKSVNTATLKMPDGNLQIVNVKDPANLDRVKVGDRIVITYSEAVSINVQ